MHAWFECLTSNPGVMVTVGPGSGHLLRGHAGAAGFAPGTDGASGVGRVPARPRGAGRGAAGTGLQGAGTVHPGLDTSAILKKRKER